MILPVPRTFDEADKALSSLKDQDQRIAYVDSIIALAPPHRAIVTSPYGAMWTNHRGLWTLTVNMRDVGYQPIVHITMPLAESIVTVPLPDHDVDYVRAMLVILGGIEPSEETPE